MDIRICLASVVSETTTKTTTNNNNRCLCPSVPFLLWCLFTPPWLIATMAAPLGGGGTPPALVVATRAAERACSPGSGPCITAVMWSKEMVELELFQLYEEEPGGSRPDRLAGVRPEERGPAAHRGACCRGVLACFGSRCSCAADG